MTLIAEQLCERIIGAAIEVHKHFGPGLLESVYEMCLEFELLQSGLAVERQTPVPIVYKGQRMNADFRADLIVEQTVLIELKAIERVLGVHEAQLLTYLRLTGLRVGLLLNFNVPRLVDGLTRRVI